MYFFSSLTPNFYQIVRGFPKRQKSSVKIDHWLICLHSHTSIYIYIYIYILRFFTILVFINSQEDTYILLLYTIITLIIAYE